MTDGNSRVKTAALVSRLFLLVLFVFPLALPALAKETLLLAEPAAPVDEAWTHQRFSSATDYESVTVDGVTAIRAIGRGSASGLYRDVGYDVASHPWLEWTWRVDKLQDSADISIKDREDFAAAIFLIFGRPGVMNRNVPTLTYVWTSDRFPPGAIVESPYHPVSGRNVVVRSGREMLGQWLHERRNVIEDFRKAFRQDPPKFVEVIALFTDNDQTREPVEAYYGEIRAVSE